MKELHAIVLGRVTNEMLRGWARGMSVQRAVSGWHGGPTFELSPPGVVEAYTDRAEAEREVELRGSYFVGVEFEIVAFVRSWSTFR